MDSTICPSCSKLVLVVDDDPVMRRMARYALSQEDLVVEEAVDGQQALERFQSLHPGLVLLDGMMPVLDGFTTCAELRRLPRGAFTPVLMVTALDDEQSVDRAFSAGATDYITKPVHWNVLRQRVRHLLQASMGEIMQARMEAVVRFARDGILTCDNQGTIDSVNPAIERLFGYDVGELVGARIHDICGDNHTALCAPGVQGEIHGRRKDGSIIPLEFSMNEFTVQGETGRMVIMRDITERREMVQNLRYSSTHDILTDLHNRAFFEEEMIRLEAEQRYPVSIVMADVDCMKDVNDQRGHSAGDQLLRCTAQVLKTAFRSSDVLARVGGDEFAVLLPLTDSCTAEAALQRVSAALTTFNGVDGHTTISLSMGVATAVDGRRLAEAWKEADKRMYDIKGARKHR